MFKLFDRLMGSPEDKALREMERLRESRGEAKRPTAPPPPPSPIDTAMAKLDARREAQAMAKPMTSERAALIQQAMAVREAKQLVLGDLDDEARAKLVLMAFRAFMDVPDRDEPDKKN